MFRNIAYEGLNISGWELRAKFKQKPIFFAAQVLVGKINLVGSYIFLGTQKKHRKTMNLLVLFTFFFTCT